MHRRLLVAALLILAGCSRTPPDTPSQSEHAMTLDQRVSGYAGTPADWRRFLDCWSREVGQARSAGPEPLVATVALAPDDGALERTIEERQRALGVALPRSYLDFIRAQRPQADWRTIAHGAGFLSLGAVDTVARLDPEGLALAQAQPLHADDGQYFVYGIDQDSATTRSRYLQDALVVGKYGDSLYEQIVLFPQVRTRDGEMEAALLGWAGTFRATSFAELMRQLHYFDLGRSDQLPPYAQDRLRGTCADAMPMREVWWK